MDLQGSSIRGWSRCRSPFKIRKFRTEAELEAYRQEIQAYSQNVAKKRFVCDGSAIKILDCATEGSSLDCWVKDNLKAGALFHADHALSKPGWKLWEPEKDWMMDVEQMLEDARKMKPGVPAGDDTPSAFLTAHTFVKAVPRASLNFCTSNDSFISDFILNEARREKLGHVVHNSGGGGLRPVYRVADDTNLPILVKY